MDLFFTQTGAGQPLVILHGWLGSGDNWRSLALRWGERYTVYALDQRDHGRSPHTEAFSYPLLVNDLAEWADQHGLDSFHLMGHSMGGKVAMLFALTYPERVRKLIVADMAPRSYPHHDATVLHALLALDVTQVKARHEVEQQLVARGLTVGTAQFLMKSLYRLEDGSFAWRFNLPLFARDYPYIVEDILEPHHRAFENPTLFIRGELSDYITAADLPRIAQYFPHYRLETFAGAGHWVHADKPDLYYETVLSFLES
jgi:pimeloyl-ACP methyl ester carboxylesterase